MPLLPTELQLSLREISRVPKGVVVETLARFNGYFVDQQRQWLHRSLCQGCEITQDRNTKMLPWRSVPQDF